MGNVARKSQHIRHAAGIVTVGLLIAACQVVWQKIPQFLDGTPFAEFRILAALAAAFALMSAAHSLCEFINWIVMRRLPSPSTDTEATPE